jgi:ferritin-like protein
VGNTRETAGKSTLIESYAKLVEPSVKRSKKVKEPEALKAMHDHFLAHRASLPADIRDHREVIVALIMDGIGVEAAFAQALEKPAFAW